MAVKSGAVEPGLSMMLPVYRAGDRKQIGQSPIGAAIGLRAELLLELFGREHLKKLDALGLG